jgi:hypothetical protein
MPRARSLRLQDGQTGAEFIGLLGLVGLIVGALFAAGVHERIAAGVNRAICTIASGTDCGTPGRGGGYASDAYPDSGRAQREIYVEECDGSVPDDPARAGDDEAVGDEQVDRAYENLVASTTTTGRRSAMTRSTVRARRSSGS